MEQHISSTLSSIASSEELVLPNTDSKNDEVCFGMVGSLMVPDALHQTF